MSPASPATWFALAALALVTLPGIANAVVVQITSNISSSQSWGTPGSGATVTADVFWVRNNINVNSTFTLTVLPGVIIKLDPGVSITVFGALQAQGTNAGNIIITSYKDDAVGGDTNGDGASVGNPSDWQGLIFTSMSPDTSRLTYTQVRFAGYGAHGALTFQGVSGKVVNCTLQKNYSAVDMTGTATPLLVDTIAQQSTSTPTMQDPSAAPVLNRFAFSQGDNGYDAFGVHGGTFSGTMTLAKQAATVGVTTYPNVTYVLLSSLSINASSTLNLAAGITLKMTSGAYITSSGTLNMIGTVTDTIRVTSVLDDAFGSPGDTNHNGSSNSPQRDDWNGLYWYAGSGGAMSYCRVRFGTNNSGYGMVDLTNTNLSITNSVLSDAAHGVVARGTASPTLNTVTIANCTSTPVMQSLTAAPTYTSLTFLNNTYTGVGLIGEAISASAHLTQRTVAGFANITYVMIGGILTINSPATVTIDPGIVIKFTPGTGITVENVLDAEGTAPSPIVFTSYRDDAYGNPADTNGDGSTLPAVGDWNQIYYDDTSVDASCKLTNSVIRYGGVYPYYTEVDCVRASPTITGNTFSNCNSAVRIEGPSTPNFSNNVVSTTTSVPIMMSAMADPTLTGNTFTSCGIYGIGLIGETLTQSAVIKYRPSVTFSTPPNAVFAYVPFNTITVPVGMTLTIQPSVVLKMNGGGTWFDIFGALNAVGGTGTGRVVFTSFKDDNDGGGDTNGDVGATIGTPGDWGSIYIEDSSVDAACVIRNALVAYGANSQYGAISTFNASPKLAAIDFIGNGTGLTCAGTSAPSCDSLNFVSSSYLPIVLSLMSSPTFAHMTFSNNSWTALGLLGETVTQSCTLNPRSFGTGILNPMAYIPTGNITIGAGVTCTIAPGNVLKLGRIFSENFGYAITVNGALNATGTSGSPIFFTSTADDGIGGDTHGDGGLTQPATDNWQGIIYSVGGLGTSALAYCRFRYGGYSGGPVVSMNSVNVPISNCTFYTCSTAIATLGNAAPAISNVQVDTCYIPVRISLVSNPTFTNVNYVNNTFTVIGVVNETLAQDALWKIRPISGRLNMPYLVDGSFGVGPGATLTMQPGVIVKLAGGSIDIQKAISAIGRTVPESLVVFTSYRDDSYGGKSWTNPSATSPNYSDWSSILIENTAIDASCVFRDCVLRYGGSGSNGAIRCINSSPTIDSTIVAYNSCGISAEGASNPLIHGSSLYGNQNYAVNNSGNAFCVTATGNYWGAANGPNDTNATADLCGTATNAGSGDIVSQNVNYAGFVTTGLQNPLLGDVSLNGQVRAYDASLVLQSLVSLVLTPLQKLVANVDNSAAIDNTDASLILQFVAGLIPALPGNATRIHPLSPAEQMQIASAARRMQGTFTLRAGTPRRVSDTWELPILADGNAEIFGAEVTLSGPAAATFTGATVASGAMEADGLVDGTAKLAMASATPIAAGEIATLRFPATGSTWQAPTITFARVNSSIVSPGASGLVPAHAYFATPWPNPTGGAATLRLGISSSEGGALARVTVYDVAGRLVRTVHDGALSPGVHELVWDLRDGAGHPAAPGVYLVCAETGGFRSVQRLVVVR
jgi:hypothetical protein